MCCNFGNYYSGRCATSQGLAFWRGRCDPRANERRIEMALALGFALPFVEHFASAMLSVAQVAYSLGVRGALQSHGLVESEVLERPCPLSKHG